jgi:type II secretory pathway component GspD/PulD (secretin)
VCSSDLIMEIAPEKVKQAAGNISTPSKPDEENAKGDLQAVLAAEEGDLLLQASVVALDNQSAQLQMGCNEPRIVGVNHGPNGATNNAIQTVNVGTQISLTPKIVGDGCVVLKLTISDSRSGPAEEGVVLAESKDSPTVKTPRDEHFTAETTVQLQDGKTLILGEMNRNGKSGKQRLISLTAKVVPPGEEK